MNRTSVMGLACLLAAVLTACAGGVEPPALSGSPVPASPEPLYPAPVSAETLEAIKQISAFLALLAEKYKDDMEGKLDEE